MTKLSIIYESLNSRSLLSSVLFLVFLIVLMLSQVITSTIFLIIEVVVILIIPGWFLLQLTGKSHKFCFLEQLSIAILATAITLMGVYVFIILFEGNIYTLDIVLAIFMITLLSWLITVVPIKRAEKIISTDKKSLVNCLPVIIVSGVMILILVSRSFDVFRPEYGNLLIGYDTPFYARIIESYKYGVPVTDNFLVGGLVLTDPPAYYILLSLLTTLTNVPAIITVVTVVISAFTTFPLFLLYRLVSRSNVIALIGVIIYQFSWFSLRFFKDLHKATFANFFLFLGLYLAIYGIREKDDFRIVLGGLSLGFTMVMHGQLIIPIIACLLLYFVMSFAITKRFDLKFDLLLLACMLAILLPSELYLWFAGGQPWIKTIMLMFGSQNLNIMRGSSSETLAFARSNVAPLHVILMTDIIPLLLGGVSLILRGKKEALWFIILAICTLVGSQLYTLGILASQAFFLWLYYGTIVSLVKAAFIFLPVYYIINLRRGKRGSHENSNQ